MKKYNFRYTVILCGFLMAASITLSGCGVSKYEKITLGSQASGQQESGSETLPDGMDTDMLSTDFAETGESGAGVEDTVGSPETVAQISLNTEETTAEQDGTAVADTSPLSSTLTTDNGFTDTDEIVYITQDKVNIRMGCSTDSKIAVQLNEGDSIKRTGYSEGWSRVVYKDNVCYVSSEFVTTTNSESESAQDVRALANATSLDAGAASASVSNGRIVAIDAGHQAKGDSDKEPVGPGASTMKAKVAAGAEGISTKTPEYKLTLSVSQKLKRILEERGYKVVMIRESNDVNISNAERAKIANNSGASIFVRIHANSHDNSTVSGALTMCQTTGNPYNGELHDKSYALSRKITDSLSTATGFKNRGVQETDTMSGINWSSIPVSIVEMGFLSNQEEDQKMAQDEYQEKIAAGIADGIDGYFAE